VGLGDAGQRVIGASPWVATEDGAVDELLFQPEGSPNAAAVRLN